MKLDWSTWKYTYPKKIDLQWMKKPLQELINKCNMENNYYTPQIEDIRIGYECQSTIDNKNWYDFKFRKFDFGTLSIELLNNIYRTPYLTKEQIEAEGWINQNDRGMSENGGAEFKKGKYQLRYWSYHPRLRIEGDLDILLETNIMKTFSINEFRYIIKLLGI